MTLFRRIGTWGFGSGWTTKGISTWGLWSGEYAPPNPPTPEPPPPEFVEATTPEQIFALITADNLEVTAGLELLDSSDVLVEDITDDFLSGEIEHQNYATIHGTCKLQISRSLPGARVRPYMTLTGAGLTKTWYRGIYLLTNPETKPGESVLTYDETGYDKLLLLMKQVGDTYFVATGTGYLAAVVQVITDSGYTGLAPLLDGTAVETTLDAPMEWVLDASTRWIDVVNDLLFAVGYRGLYADANGRYCSEPYQSPLVRAPLWTLDMDDIETVIAGEDRTIGADIFNAPNWFRFVAAGLTATPTDGTGQYTVDLSDSGVKVKYVEREINVADQTALEAYGDSVVQQCTQLTKTVTVPVDFLPMWHFDVFTYQDAAGVMNHKCEARSWTQPLSKERGELTLEVL